MTTKTKSAKTVEALDTANTIVRNSATSLPTLSVVFVVVQGIWLVIVLSDVIPMLSSTIPPLHRTDRRGCRVPKALTLNMPASWPNSVKGGQLVEVMILSNHPGVPPPPASHRLPTRIFLLGVVPKYGNLQVSVEHKVDKAKEGIAHPSRAMVELESTEELPEAMEALPKDMDRGHIQAIKPHMDSNHRITQALTRNTINSSIPNSNLPNKLTGTTSIFLRSSLTSIPRTVTDFIFSFGGGNDVGRYIRRLWSQQKLHEAVSIELVHVLTQLIVASHSPMTLQCMLPR